ncbi:hypothetical protein MNBD_DELTA03-1878 [hydrothermal vent metagenome]|uniref:Uncharacterized protein n=1 Tax=hydrothermal vent metagenome TaxID=652676 RepID=A0A3B0VU94_9ZZZZ
MWLLAVRSTRLHWRQSSTSSSVPCVARNYIDGYAVRSTRAASTLQRGTHCVRAKPFRGDKEVDTACFVIARNAGSETRRDEAILFFICHA